MKKNVLKAGAVTVFSCVFAISMVGCGGSSSSSSVPQPTQTPAVTDDAQTGTAQGKLGLGAAITPENMEMGGKLSHTVAAVLVDDAGRIISSKVDTHESQIGAAEGVLQFPEAVESKYEKGDAYGMKAASSIDKEWYEQADAFCAYINGKTYDEVMKIGVDSYGKPTETDLMAGCTISITDFQTAVAKACRNATGERMELDDTDKDNMTDGMDDATGTENGNGLGGMVDDVIEGAQSMIDDVMPGQSTVHAE